MPDTADQSFRPQRQPELWLLALIAVVLAGLALRAMASVFVPVILAFFLALVIYPLDRLVAEALPGKLRWLGHVLALLVVMTVVLLFLGCLWLAAEQLISRFGDADYSGITRK